MVIQFFDHDPALRMVRLITLTDTDPVVNSTSGGPTEEGWNQVHAQWTYETDEAGQVWVLHTCATDGSDCDGRLMTYCEVRCPLDRLAAVAPQVPEGYPPAPYMLPNWQAVQSGQRDYAAEAAGY